MFISTLFLRPHPVFTRHSAFSAEIVSCALSSLFLQFLPQSLPILHDYCDDPFILLQNSIFPASYTFSMNQINHISPMLKLFYASHFAYRIKSTSQACLSRTFIFCPKLYFVICGGRYPMKYFPNLFGRNIYLMSPGSLMFCRVQFGKCQD